MMENDLNHATECSKPSSDDSSRAFLVSQLEGTIPTFKRVTFSLQQGHQNCPVFFFVPPHWTQKVVEFPSIHKTLGCAQS